MSADLDRLLDGAPFGLPEADKVRALLPVITEQLRNAQGNRHISNLFTRLGIDIERIDRLEDVPPIPVQMFKRFDLSTCSSDDVLKTLRSSGTTSGQPSRVPLDKLTMRNQSRALSQLLADVLGSRRRPFLIIDHPGMNTAQDDFSARTAGIRGLSLFAREAIYLLKEVDGRLELDRESIERIADLGESEVYAFGFTYIVWTEFLPRILELGRTFEFADFKLFHSGGWKRLAAMEVSKERFSEETACVFGASPGQILDFYGMAEQAGLIFVDCPEGHKHVPVFAQVIVRNVADLGPCDPGQPGMIEVMSSLGHSYFSQALLTEDLGSIGGVDDCPCGRLGRHFTFASRIERSELRGCGDTFRVS